MKQKYLICAARLHSSPHTRAWHATIAAHTFTLTCAAASTCSSAVSCACQDTCPNSARQNPQRNCQFLHQAGVNFCSKAQQVDLKGIVYL